jgi:cytochrome P450
MHDPKVYSDPMSFNPARFLGLAKEQDPREVCFGFGRRYALIHFLGLIDNISAIHRICPGGIIL